MPYSTDSVAGNENVPLRICGRASWTAARASEAMAPPSVLRAGRGYSRPLAMGMAGARLQLTISGDAGLRYELPYCGRRVLGLVEQDEMAAPREDLQPRPRDAPRE